MAETHIPHHDEPLFPPPQPVNHRNRRRWLILITSIFLLAAIGWMIYYLLIGRFYVYTENAYVHGNEMMLTPEVSGNVVAIYADDTDLVEEGQVIVSLDSTDYQIALDMKTALLAETTRRVVALFDAVKAREATLALKKAELLQYELDNFHRSGLIGSHAVSLEEYEQSATNVKVALASVDVAEKEYEMAKAQVEGTTVSTHPLIEDAVASLREAFINLLRCEVRAPARGYVAKRSVQIGEHILAGQTMLAIVPLDYLWGEANYKETQLKKVRIGQPVSFTTDLYGRDVEYEGKVVGFTAGTGDAFAILPAQNASGNWIKIIQRLPIRISIPAETLAAHPLMIGLSLRVTIDVSDTSGEMLSCIPSQCPVYYTSIFDRKEELETFNKEIEKIIQDNSYVPSSSS